MAKTKAKSKAMAGPHAHTPAADTEHVHIKL